MRKHLKAIFVLSILGIIDALYLTYLHYYNAENVLCNINQKFNCHSVATSSYSELFGVSVAFLGFIMFSIIAVLALYSHFENNKNNSLRGVQTISILMAVSLLFGGYLFYIQYAVLKTYCSFCIALDAIIILAFILSVIAWIKQTGNK